MVLGQSFYSKQTVGPVTATGTTNHDNNCHGVASDVKFRLTIDAASGTTPSMTLTMQHSVDGVNWGSLTPAFAAKTAAAQTEEITVTTGKPIGPCLRHSYAISGTTPSFTYTLTAYAV